MAVIAGTIKGIMLLSEPWSGSGRQTAEVSVTYPAYVASTDTTNIAAVGAAIAARRRDGRTVTLTSVAEGQAGKQGTTEFFNDTLVISTDAVTGELANTVSTEIDAPAGVQERPCTIRVSYQLSAQ